MGRQIAFLILAFVQTAPFGFAVRAETPNLCLMPPAGLIRPFFYRITRGEHTAHILGTLHAGLPLSAMPPAVAREIDAATIGVREAWETSWWRHAINVYGARSHAMRNLEPPLARRLTRADYAQLVARLNQNGYATAQIDALAPAGAIMALGDGPEREHGQLDLEITQRLQARKTPIAGLEREAAQVKIIREAYTLTALRQQLRDRPWDHTAELCRVYWTGDEAALRAEAEDYRAEDPFTQMVSLARSRAWVPRIEQILEHHARAFFYFGGGHLFGAQGVLAQLERAGFTVERLD